MHGAEAVRPGVAAADDHHLLAPSGDRRLHEGTLTGEVGAAQVVHREVHAGELTPGDLEVAGARRTDGEQHGVEVGDEGGGGDRGQPLQGGGSRDLGRRLAADRVAGAEDRPLGFHLCEAAVDHPLLELELRHPVADEAADALGTLEDDHRVPGAGELLCGSQPRGPGADDGDPPPGRRREGAWATRPAPAAQLAISTSTCLIETGSSEIPSTQEPSQGAGQRRPVNSGKLFVACRRSLASASSPRQTRSFHSGMRFPSGQPS